MRMLVYTYFSADGLEFRGVISIMLRNKSRQEAFTHTIGQEDEDCMLCIFSVNQTEVHA